MANRSYLYACNEVPGTQATPEKNIKGLSECNYVIPLAYKILLSANPRMCRSRIWNTEEPMALTCNYDAGLARLNDFLNRITLKQAKPTIDATLAFLHDPKNKGQYFLLECGEIFELGEAELGEQNTLLLENLSALDESIESALGAINQQAHMTSKKRFNPFLRRKDQQRESDEAINALAGLGLNNWSNTLYFNFS